MGSSPSTPAILKGFAFECGVECFWNAGWNWRQAVCYRDVECDVLRLRRHEEFGLMANPFEFIQEVRAEVSKVTWPTQKETVVTTIMVLIMVVMAAIFFFAADQVLNVLVQLLIGSGQS